MRPRKRMRLTAQSQNSKEIMIAEAGKLVAGAALQKSVRREHCEIITYVAKRLHLQLQLESISMAGNEAGPPLSGTPHDCCEHHWDHAPVHRAEIRDHID